MAPSPTFVNAQEAFASSAPVAPETMTIPGDESCCSGSCCKIAYSVVFVILGILALVCALFGMLLTPGFFSLLVLDVIAIAILSGTYCCVYGCCARGNENDLLTLAPTNPVVIQWHVTNLPNGEIRAAPAVLHNGAMHMPSPNPSTTQSVQQGYPVHQEGAMSFSSPAQVYHAHPNVQHSGMTASAPYRDNF